MSNYLRREADSFIFRRRIPDHLQRRLGQREIYRTLKTTVRKIAKERAAQLYVATERLFRMVEQSDESTLSDEDIRAAVRHWLCSKTWRGIFENNLDHLSPGALRENYAELPEILLRDYDGDRLITAEENAIEHAWAALEYSDFNGTGRGATLARTISVLRELLRERVDRRMQEVFSPESLAQVTVVAPPRSGSGPTAPPNMSTISTYIPKWQVDIIKGYNHEKPKSYETYDQYLQTVQLFIGLMGDLPVSKITHDVAAEFREKLLMLPRTHGKGRTGSVKKELDRAKKKTDVPKLSMKTAKRHFSGMNSLWRWLVFKKHVPAGIDPFSGHAFPGTKSKKSARDDWSSEDLRKLFTSVAYREALKDSALHWMPLISLHSGLRLEEIGRLRTDSDLVTRDGVLCFNIQARENWDPKTEAGQRIVPVHSWLLKHGFREFVDRQKAKRASYLFPEMRTDKQKFTADFSRTFSRIKKKNGIGDKTTFHSFRHTFRTGLESTDHKESHINAIMGHEGGSGEGQVYAKRVTTAKLKEVVESFTPSLDLGFLEGGMYPVASTLTPSQPAVRKVKLTPPTFDENGKVVRARLGSSHMRSPKG